MGIISKLKSVLGVENGDRAPQSGAGTSVTVEREPAAPGERAVKGVDSEPSSPARDVDDEGEVDAGADGDGRAETVEDDRSAPVDEGDSPEDDGEPVDSIKGIGTAYADRLAAAGVHSVSDLADADAEDLASKTDLGAGRIGNWIERARARTR